MEELFKKAKTLGIDIKDQRNIGMGFHVVNDNPEGCFLSYRSDNGFYINQGSNWYFTKESVDTYTNKLSALGKLMDELNKKLK